MNLDKWAERIYVERDFGRGIATSITGILGLLTYLYTNDWVIAAFAGVIGFPIIRILASAAHSVYSRRKHLTDNEREAKDLYAKFSEEEKEVIREFVRVGGSVMSWSHANRVNLSEPGVASLMQREVLYPTMSPDGMREAFGVRVDIFDVAQKEYAESPDF